MKRAKKRGMGWKQWDGVGWDGMGWEGMRWDGMAWEVHSHWSIRLKIGVPRG